MKYTNSSPVTERAIADAVAEFLRSSGYRILPSVRIRTWRPDIVGLKGDEVLIVEAKGQTSDLRRALAQTALYSTDASAAYLALPAERIDGEVRGVARVLGIGLIGVRDAARIELKAVPSKPRPSLLRRIRKARGNPVRSGTTRPKTSPHLGRLLKHPRVLEVLLARPGRRFTIRELSQEARIPYSTTWRIAQDLEVLGVVVSERAGTARVLSTNPQAPVVRELRNLAGLELSPHRLAAKEFAERLASISEVREAILFGSVARRTESPTSDVDVAVVLERKDDSLVDRIYDIAQGVQDRTRMKIVPLFVTEAELDSKDPIAKSIKSGVVLLGRS